jgi:hypothetical protein
VRASVHSMSPSEAELPGMVYLGSWETSVCRKRRVTSAQGDSSVHSIGVLMPLATPVFSVVVAERRDISEASVVLG